MELRICVVRWRDACQVEAEYGGAAVPELAELTEVGFFLAENDDALLIGMEVQHDNTHPERWRLNIPKSGIVSRQDYELDINLKLKPVRARKRM